MHGQSVLIMTSPDLQIFVGLVLLAVLGLAALFVPRRLRR